MLERARGIWQRLVGKRGGAVEDERRVWVRRPSVATAVVRPGGEGRVPARARDISRGGISVVVGQPFDSGTMLCVEVASSPAQASFSVLACVVRVSPLGEQQWLLGCRFCAELSARDLARFTTDAGNAGADEDRGWPRSGCDLDATLVVADEKAEEEQTARVVNISPGGAALIVGGEVPAGTVFTLAVEGRVAGLSCTVVACAVHVTSFHEGKWLVGCSFIRELSEDDLRALL